MADMMMPEGMPMDPMMGGGMPPAEGIPMDPMMGGGMPPMDMMPPEGEAPMEEMGDELAEEGRGGDQIVGHLTPGEIVIPTDILDEELTEILDEFFAENGISMAQYTVGHEENSINPETGMPEFFFGGPSGYKDPRRNWAAQSSYWGYTGTESGQRKDTRKQFGISMADWNRFDQYMRTYRQQGTQGSILDKMQSFGVFETGYGRDLKRQVFLDELKGGNTYNYVWQKNPEWQKLISQAKTQQGEAMGYLNMNKNQRNQLLSKRQKFVTGSIDSQSYNKMMTDARAGRKVRANWNLLSEHQKAGPWQHAERYADDWANMSDTAQRRVFEDYMNIVSTEKKAPYAGIWGGAGKGWGDMPGGGFKSRSIEGNPYIPLDADQQKAYDALNPGDIEYRTLAREKSISGMMEYTDQMKAQQEAYLQRLRAELQAERDRAVAERKKAQARQTRLNRIQAAGGGDTAAADDAVADSVTDPRSMVARSYRRRSAYGGGGGLVTGFISGDVGYTQRPS